MPVSLCKHSFPVQPPHGSLAHPGDCSGCGRPYRDVQHDLARQEERHRIATAARGRCAGCKLPDRMLFTFTAPPAPWNPNPVPRRYCTPCWSRAQLAVDKGVPFTFDETYHHGTDEQLLRFLGYCA